jgi:NTP pyrophosphatase (non-canonical NTP hydrolase)
VNEQQTTQRDELLALADLRRANVTRQKEWDAFDQLTLAYRGNELAGEVGEACNVIKKLERERLGIKGSRDTVEHLAEELADIIICTDLIAMQAGIDLSSAVIAKFNASSEKVGLATRLAAIDALVPADGVRERPSDCANPIECGWHHVSTEPEIGLWLCSYPGCNHMTKAQTEGEKSSQIGMDWTLSDEAKQRIAEIDAAIVRPGDPRLATIIGGETAFCGHHVMKSLCPICSPRPSEATPAPADEVRMNMTEDQIKHMADRFLGWKLPENFSPDCGISFKRTHSEQSQWGPQKYEPTGTNLFDATQADAMIRYMIDGLPAPADDAAVAWQYLRADGKWCACWKPNADEMRTAPSRFRPLYTHPAKAVDVEQLRELIETFDINNSDWGFRRGVILSLLTTGKT